MAQILWQNKFATKIKMDKGDINVELLLVQTNFHLFNVSYIAIEFLKFLMVQL